MSCVLRDIGLPHLESMHSALKVARHLKFDKERCGETIDKEFNFILLSSCDFSELARRAQSRNFRRYTTTLHGSTSILTGKIALMSEISPTVHGVVGEIPASLDWRPSTAWS